MKKHTMTIEFETIDELEEHVRDLMHFTEISCCEKTELGCCQGKVYCSEYTDDETCEEKEKTQSAINAAIIERNEKLIDILKIARISKEEMTTQMCDANCESCLRTFESEFHFNRGIDFVIEKLTIGINKLS